MAYSFTEKKRIRKSFAKRASVLQVPFLLATQIDSYAAFLQADARPEKRKNQGLQAAFQLDLSDRQPFRQCPSGFRQLSARHAAVRRRRNASSAD